jgi:hypothetical protein
LVERLLTLDAGLQTGWAYFEGGVLQDSGVIDFRTEEDFRELTKGLPQKPTRVVMEITRPHVGRLYKRLRAIQNALIYKYPQCECIQPYQWKPSHDRKPLPKKCKTQHERDAIRIGLWVLTRLTHETML